MVAHCALSFEINVWYLEPISLGCLSPIALCALVLMALNQKIGSDVRNWASWESSVSGVSNLPPPRQSSAAKGPNRRHPTCIAVGVAKMW